MSRHEREIRELLQEPVAALGYRLWGVECAGAGRRMLLRVYIDADSGITLADCERASSAISGVLDVEDPVRGSYDLEVSSPGTDRRLFTLEQYRSYLGRDVDIRLRSGMDGRRRVRGSIRDVSGNSVVIMSEGAEIQVAEVDIEKARLVPGQERMEH